MTIPEPRQLDLDWAEKRWQDPLTGTDVVCLSPNRKMHFRNNYYSLNMMTWDGRYVVFLGHDDIRDGVGVGNRSMWARDMITGEVRELGPFPEVPESLVPFIRSTNDAGHWAVARYSHRVNAWDMSDPDAWTIIQYDIDTSGQRRIVPSQPIGGRPYFPNFSADERHLYVQQKEKFQRAESMDAEAFRQMIAHEPGPQQMLRIDLETGEVELAHENVRHDGVFNLEHPMPHPVHSNIFFSGARILDFDTGEWLDHLDDPAYPRWHGQGHIHWAQGGKRFYSHQWPSPNVHCISRVDLETGENRWWAGMPHTGFSQHCHISPDESFLVGDGYEFDRNTLPPEIRTELQARIDDGRADPVWCEFYLRDDLTNGGEVIWKYELPEESVLDDPKYWRDYDHMYEAYRHENARLLDADVIQNPDKLVRATPVCTFRTMLRSPQMLGYRLESNAHVTPDSRWAVFQSSSEDNLYEVWAARVPGAVDSE